MGPRRFRRSAVVTICVGAALLAGSWLLVAMAAEPSGWEASWFRSINGWPDVVEVVLRPPMQVGSVVGSLIVVVVTLLVCRSARLALAALVASQAAYWGVQWIKNVVARGRPIAVLAGVHDREHATGLGYPFGHTAVAVALATLLVPSLPPRWRVVAIAVAGLVGLARIYVGAHLPLDVVGGVGVGLVLGATTRFAFGLAQVFTPRATT